MLFKLIIHKYLYHVFVEAVAEETLIVSSFIFLCLAAAKKYKLLSCPFVFVKELSSLPTLVDTV